MDIYQFAEYAAAFTNELWVKLLVGFLCFVIVYIFQGMGLTVIAGHEGYSHRWMAWVPFLQLYYIGVCAQKNKVMNSFNTKGFAIAAVLFDVALFVGYTLLYISDYLTTKYQVWIFVPITDTYSYKIFYGFDLLPATLEWAAWIYQYIEYYILQWLKLIFIIIKLFLFTSFYRTYSSRRYVLFSVVGALTPLNGIIIYVVRNNKGLNYNDYLRKVREENYRRYQQQQQQNMYNQNPYSQNPYNNQYNNPYNNNPYNNNNPQGNQSAAPDPFDEFNGSGSADTGSNTSGNTNGNTNGNINTGGNDESPFDDF